MRPCAARSPGLTRTSYSVLGARTMHVMLDRREVAERRGAGHVARCTACTAHGRLGPAMVSGAPNRRTLRARLLEDQCPADLVRRHFEAFAPCGLWVADIPHCVGGIPSYVRTMSGRVHVAFARRRLLPEDHRLADHLPASAHRPGHRRPENGYLAAPARGC